MKGAFTFMVALVFTMLIGMFYFYQNINDRLTDTQEMIAKSCATIYQFGDDHNAPD